MRRMTLIRCGVASVLLGGVVAVGMFAAGCGGDDNGGKPGPGDDSGADATQPPPGDDTTDDSGTVHGDGGPGSADADAGPPAPVHGKLILVHASSFAPALRFCFGSVTGTDAGDAGSVTITPSYAAPNTALGVPPGTGGPAADTSVDLANRTLEIYAINAAALTSQVPGDAGTELTCDKLIGSKALAADAGGIGLRPGFDYWDIGTLPAGTLADGTTTLLAVNGCTPGLADVNDQLVECPAGYNPSVGDLGFWSAKLDTTTPLDGGSIGAQFAYASYPFSLVGSTAGGVAAVAGFYLNTTTTIFPDAGAPPDGGDAGDAAVEAAAPITVPVTVPFYVASGVTNGQLAPTTTVPVSNITFDGTSGFFVSSITADGGPVLVAPSTPLKVALPLPNIQQISAPSADGGYFANGSGYVFVLVGNPKEPSFTVPDGGDAGQFNVLSAHILGFPTNPPFGN